MPPCAVCGDPTSPNADLACEDCGMPHHPDCWGFAGGCSRFGCGGLESRPLGEAEPAAALEIQEGAAVAEVRRPLLPAIWRRLRGPAHVLPRTVGMGLGGAALGTGLLLFFGVVTTGETFAIAGLLGSGLMHGLLAPYLGPVMHRAPLRVAGLSGLAFLGLSLWAQGNPIVPTLIFLPFFGALLMSCMICSASLAEGILGPRTAPGQRLGGLSLPGRVLATWSFATVLWLLHVSQLSAFSGLSLEFLTSVSLITLVVAPSASPALERGKAEFRGWLPERTGESQAASAGAVDSV